jgi:hypothetical protein
MWYFLECEWCGWALYEPPLRHETQVYCSSHCRYMAHPEAYSGERPRCLLHNERLVKQGAAYYCAECIEMESEKAKQEIEERRRAQDTPR